MMHALLKPLLAVCLFLFLLLLFLLHNAKPSTEAGSLYDAEVYMLKEGETVHHIIILRDGTHAVLRSEPF